MMANLSREDYAGDGAKDPFLLLGFSRRRHI